MAVRTRTVEQSKASGGDAGIEEYLDSKGIIWKFIPKVPTAEFDVDKSLHNQARFQAIDDERVISYAEAMRRGDRFPPVIAHRVKNQFVITDGNHRLLAAQKARKPLSVYEITGTETQLLMQVAYERNTKHGWPTSEDERIVQALWLMNNGATMDSAAAALMLPKKALVKASAKEKTDRRFREAGISNLVTERLAESTKVRLAQVTTDEAFIPLVDLADRARLSQEEVFRLVTQVNEIRSTAKQVAFVKDQFEVYADRLAATGGGVISRRQQGPKGRMAMALGQFAALPDDATIIAGSYLGDERAEAATRMRATARRLNEIAKLLAG